MHGSPVTIPAFLDYIYFDFFEMATYESHGLEFLHILTYDNHKGATKDPVVKTWKLSISVFEQISPF